MSFVKLKFVFKKENYFFDKLLVISKRVFFHGFEEGRLKRGFYKMGKMVKIARSDLSVLSFLGRSVQINGFYKSMVECKREQERSRVARRVLLFGNRKVAKHFFSKSSKKKKRVVFGRKPNQLAFSRGLDKFEKFYGDYSRKWDNRSIFIQSIKRKRFFNRMFFSRLFLLSLSGKKNYRNTLVYIFKRRRKIDSIFHVYALASLKYREVKRQRKKRVKRFAWKIRKMKKWRRKGFSSYRVRLRQKLSKVFYVPKHLEVNYKTMSTFCLGFVDLKTTNSRVNFWLNLRKLLTFLV